MKVSAIDQVPAASRRKLVEDSSYNNQMKQKNNDSPEVNTSLTAVKEGEKEQLSEKKVIETIEKANESLAMIQTRFEFSIHEKTKEIMIKVYNKETDELIREIPPEKILDMIAKMWELAGLFVDEKV